MRTRDRLARNLADVRARIAGVRPDATLVAVTKTVEPSVALTLAELGVEDLGESRVSELERKQAAFERAGRCVRWHFLGHLQRNKARRVVQRADVLHSVDSLRLLELLGRLAAEEGRCPALFLQVKLNDEESKGGLDPAELPAALERAQAFRLPLSGLMTMAPLVAEADAPAAARATFRRLAELGRSLPAAVFGAAGPRYSMGMSGDFEIALTEGADVVRIGSRLFEGLDDAAGGGDAATPPTNTGRTPGAAR